MRKKEKCSNEVIISGTVIKDFELDHYEVGVRYFICEIECRRRSGTMDIVKVMVSEKQVDTSYCWLGQEVEVYGEYHSFDEKKEEADIKVKMFVKAKEFHCTGEQKWHNEVALLGYVCAKPKYREVKTKRVCTLILAVPRYGATDYIPCVFWEEDAVAASTLRKGEKINVYGRVQSRDYIKRSGNEVFDRTTSEVSVKGYMEVKNGSTNRKNGAGKL